ncbi:MAG: mRNA surveillance protein pelota [Halobacteria archaeon]
MKVFEKELDENNHGYIELSPENLDDLWHLKYIVEPEDLIEAVTQRRVEGPQDKIRSDSGERETMEVKLRVDDVEFHRFSNRLRISGIIKDCPRETEIEDHHTVNLEVNESFKLWKEWQMDQLERLKEAEDTRDSEVVIATVEEGEVQLFSVEEYGVEERGTFTHTTGKGEDARPRKDLFRQLTGGLRNLDADAVILAGPGFTKKDAYSHIEKNSDLADDITLVDTSSAGERGVHEVLKRGAVEKVAEETRISRESRYIDELMKEISRDGKATFGIEEVEKALDYGAVERLLVEDETLRKNRERVNPLIEETEQKGGDVTVLSSEFEPGQRLRNLGGVAAILRYSIS